MAKVSVLLLVFLLSACTTGPKVQPIGGGNYIVWDEAEFGFTDMVAEVYSEAEEHCTKQGKQFKVVKTHNGRGSTGAFGSKQVFQVYFRCDA